jgi:flagellar secretion chaperone FliS
MTDPARAYRELAARGASPVGLVVILYEEIIRSLRRALDAAQRNQIERRTNELSHAIVVVGYLQSVLDYEQGGQVARDLSDFYNTARSKILECSGPHAVAILEALSSQFSSLAEGWQQVDREIGQPLEAEPVMAGAVATPISRGEPSRRARIAR